MNQRHRIKRLRVWVCSLGLLQATGCAIDPDIIFNAVFQVATDAAVFFIDNAVVAGR